MKNFIENVKDCTEGCNKLEKTGVLLLGLMVVYGIIGALFLSAKDFVVTWL